jgi:hypothetical protein
MEKEEKGKNTLPPEESLLYGGKFLVLNLALLRQFPKQYRIGLYALSWGLMG